MASIIETLVQRITPALIEQAGVLTGVDEQLAREGLDLAGPLLVCAMNRQAATATGAMVLLELSGGLASRAGTDAVHNGDWLVDELFGSGRGTIEAVLEQELARTIGPLLSLVAPLVFQVLGELIEARELDEPRLAELLDQEMQQYAAAHPETARLIETALTAGEELIERAATTRIRFGAEEWQALLVAPFHAAGAIIAAAPDSEAGRLAEIAAIGAAMAQRSEYAPPDSLIGALTYDARERLAAADRSGTLASLQGDPAGIVDAGIAACQRAATILASEASAEEADSYRRWLMAIVTSVAQAVSEAAVGDRSIDGNEQTVLEQIAIAVGVAV